MQDAYEWGRNMVKDIRAQQEVNDKNNPNACMGRISKAIANRNFTLAEEWAINLYNIDEKNGYYWLGLVNELQGNPSYAKSYYKEGVELGDNKSHKALERLEQEGPLTDTQINNAVQYFANQNSIIEGMANQMTNNTWNSSESSSSSSRRVCPSCRGSKKGIEKIYYAPNYTGKDYREYCKICNEWTSPHSHHTPSCPVCYGRGYVE